MTNEQWIDNIIESFKEKFQDGESWGEVNYNGTTHNVLPREIRPFIREVVLSALHQGEQRFAERLQEELKRKKSDHCGKKDCLQAHCANRAARREVLSEISTLITSELEKK